MYKKQCHFLVNTSFENGQGGIRTLDTPKRILVFETSAFNRSATCPRQGEEYNDLASS